MKELLDQLLDEVRSAMRFRWYGMLVAWVGCLGGWSWVAWQPDVFEGNARVYVDTASVLEPVLGNQIVAQNVDAQLSYVRESLLGREQLETVARETGLDAGANAAQRDAILQGLRFAVQIDSSGARTRNTPDNIYTISYRNSDRHKAVDVVAAVLDTFVESTLGANRLQGDTAERFLDERVEEYELRLAQAEQALATFKKENANRLPGAEGGYFQRMQGVRDALALANRDLRVLESKRQQLDEQLRGERAVVPGVTGLETQPPPNSLDARIRDHEARLDTMLLQYTERHPDVIALRLALDRLLAQRAEQLIALGVDDAEQELLGLEANPVYQALRIAIAETDVDIATLRADIRVREDSVDELQGLIDEVPEVEAQLARLNRDYDVVYQQYLALARSRETQELTRKATDTDQIDFRIINPPFSSFTPVAPNRLMLLAIVFVGSIAAGGGLCYLLGQLSPVFHGGNTLRRQIGLPVLGVVTHAWQESWRARQRLAIGSYVGALAMLVLLFGGLVGTELFGAGLHQLIG